MRPRGFWPAARAGRAELSAEMRRRLGAGLEFVRLLGDELGHPLWGEAEFVQADRGIGDL